jgi:hypothetical protein
LVKEKYQVDESEVDLKYAVSGNIGAYYIF